MSCAYTSPPFVSPYSSIFVGSIIYLNNRRADVFGDAVMRLGQEQDLVCVHL